MTPAYDLNSLPSPFPFLELSEDQQLQFFIPSYDHQASSSLSSPIFFNIPQDQERAADDHHGQLQKYQHKAEKYFLHSGSSDHRVIPSSSLHDPVVDPAEYGRELSIFKLENEGEDTRENESSKWMPPKMRIMRKMMNKGCEGGDKQERIMHHKFHNQQQDHSETTNSPSKTSSDIIRVCSDCNTTKTPLWRSGPQGPKSLCNACGIRQRKARRAMAAAAAEANGTTLTIDNSTTRTKLQNKEKKSRTSYMAQYKKPLIKLPASGPPIGAGGGERVSFEDFTLNLSKNSAIQRAFPKDEEEAAILLMALSCGRPPS